MADRDDLITTRSNLITARLNLSAAAAAGTAKPSYSVNGQSFTWEGYYRWLGDEIARVTKEIANDGDNLFEESTYVGV